MMTSSDRTHLVKASERRRETSQTPGMDREEAVRTPSMWAGIAKTAPHAFSGWHHHGAYESVIFVLRGAVRLEYGPGGKETLDGAAGETLYVAPGEVHREGNPGDEPSEIVVVRGGEGELVINETGPAPG
jgi:uncharacterized RmlC-like cupin family protein